MTGAFEFADRRDIQDRDRHAGVLHISRILPEVLERYSERTTDAEVRCPPVPADSGSEPGVLAGA